MKLYEINEAIENFEFEIDPETGEILNYDALDALEVAKEEKIENIALFVKNLTAEAKALKGEKQAFEKRQKTVENKLARMKDYLSYALDGEKFKTSKVSVSYRKSEKLNIADGAEIPEAFFRVKEPEINLTDLKQAIKNGVVVKGVSLVERQNLMIR